MSVSYLTASSNGLKVGRLVGTKMKEAEKEVIYSSNHYGQIIFKIPILVTDFDYIEMRFNKESVSMYSSLIPLNGLIQLTPKTREGSNTSSITTFFKLTMENSYLIFTSLSTSIYLPNNYYFNNDWDIYLYKYS